MTPEELINSGLLEAYVLGRLEDDDARLVEDMRLQHESVRSELAHIEEAVEKLAVAHPVAPSGKVREAILERIRRGATPQTATDGRRIAAPPAEESTKNTAPVRNWLAAAAIMAFMLSAGVNVILWRDRAQVANELGELQEDREQLVRDQMDSAPEGLTGAEEFLAVITDPDTEVVFLAGTGQNPDARGKLYWDPRGGRLHLCTFQLPLAPEGLQYQIWAIVDGWPVNAGLVPQSSVITAVLPLDVVQVQAFAVTIETAGGSEAPTEGAMVLLGEV